MALLSPKLLAIGSLFAVLAAPAPAQRTCTFVEYGTSCGPTLSGVVHPNGNTDKFRVTASGVQTDARILFLVGAQKLDIDLGPIFGAGSLGCSLLVRPDFLQQHIPDNSGKYVWSHALPSTYAGVAWCQIAELRKDGTIKTSNGLQLTCAF